MYTKIQTTEEKFILAGCISSAKTVYQICLFWAGGRPIRPVLLWAILLFEMSAYLLTRVEHWNKQVPTCWHHSKLRNTHLTLVLSRNFSCVFPRSKYGVVESSGSLGPRTIMNLDLKHGFKWNAKACKLYT